MPFSAYRFTHSSSIFLVFSRTIAVKHGAHEFLQRLQMMLRWACYITWIAAASLTGALAEALVAAQFSSLLNAGSNCINSFLWSEHVLFFLMAECRDTFGAHANAIPFYFIFCSTRRWRGHSQRRFLGLLLVCQSFQWGGRGCSACHLHLRSFVRKKTPCSHLGKRRTMGVLKL